jgi:hypothetical protein
LDLLGVSLHAVVHHTIELPLLVSAWQPAAADTILLDADRGFFKAIGENWGSLWSLASPTVIGQFRKAQKAGFPGDTKGEGRLLGGMLVMGKGDSGIAMLHKESRFGDRADAADVLAAAKRAVDGNFAQPEAEGAAAAEGAGASSSSK